MIVLIDIIFDGISYIFSWQFILAIIIFADIWSLYTIKHGVIWNFRELYNTDINLILNSIKNMDGRDFELFIGYLFELKGCKVEVTQATNDHGVDILVDDNVYIECKHWDKKNLINREIVSKLVGSAYALSGGKDFKTLVITTGRYNRTAIDYAKLTDTKLWDTDDILKMIKELNTTKILRYLNYDRKIWEAKEVKS